MGRVAAGEYRFDHAPHPLLLQLVRQLVEVFGANRPSGVYAVFVQRFSRQQAGRAGGEVLVTVPAGEALWLSAAELEQGGDGFEGSLGDGEGKWRLTVSSAAPLAVMSLVEDAEGALSNLSTPGRR